MRSDLPFGLWLIDKFRLPEPPESVLQPIAIGDNRGLCLLKRGEKFACGCGDLVLLEPFKIGNDPAQLNDLPRNGPDDSCCADANCCKRPLFA